MSLITFPTSKDIYLEIDGRRVAAVQEYKSKAARESRYVEAFGADEPVGAVAGRTRYLLELSRVAVCQPLPPEVDFYGLENFNPDGKEMAALMERQMSAMSSLRRLMDFSGPLDGSPQQFSGWKVKVDIEGMDADGRSYHSEYWFILDKEAQCVVKSFEIPLP